MVADSEDPDRELREMIRQDRKGTTLIVDEDGLDGTRAQINYIEAIIRKSLGWIDAILWIFLIIGFPDPSAGETDLSQRTIWCPNCAS